LLSTFYFLTFELFDFACHKALVPSVYTFNLQSTSHERLFFVEVMGRDAGFLALNGAIASGAEAAIIPEFSTEVDQLEEFIKNGFRKSKNSSIVLVAESELTGGAMHYAERVKNEYPQYDVRVTAVSRILSTASRIVFNAVSYPIVVSVP